jgi:hypothetical protein
MKLPIIQLSLAFCAYCRLDPNVFLHNWVSNAPQPMLFSERERNQLSDPYEM